MRAHHLGEAVHDYVDGLLDAERTLRVERHLLVCTMCRAQVEQERRLVESLRAFRPDPRRQQDLMAGLLGLADEAPIPPAPAPRRTPSLVMCDAPPQYESVRQHPMLLALVAVAGCVGVSLVVVSLPSRAASTGGVNMPASVRLTTSPGADTAPAGGVVPAAVARAERDADDAVQIPDPRALHVRASVRVP
ncbi:anti-sigma factor family protein [Luteipulveratus halotolerans]|uniref:anti-sigma factor family protein n=1 Tax=Luteipulveratus halotolerans TaxID=1631356 RepID=UPI0018D1F233|nr:zf-HC2 domain-containing protein [Luteipulveratus halotolerans]